MNKNLASIVLGLSASLATASCVQYQQYQPYQRIQRAPEPVPKSIADKAYIISGKVKGESTEEFTYEVGPALSALKLRTEKGQKYSFVLETDRGLKMFTSEIRAGALNALINPGDEVKVECYYLLTEKDIDNIFEFSNRQCYSDHQFDQQFAVIEINGRKVK